MYCTCTCTCPVPAKILRVALHFVHPSSRLSQLRFSVSQRPAITNDSMGDDEPAGVGPAVP
jgi:hypothetical protein